MFKKNIAKLLVFAMILSMLPFSAVTAGAVGDTINSANDNAYAIAPSSVYIEGVSSSKLALGQHGTISKADKTYTIEYDVGDDTDAHDYVVVVDSVTVGFKAGSSTVAVYYVADDAKTEGVTPNGNTKVDTSSNKNVTFSFTLADVGTEKSSVTTKFAAYTNSDDTEASEFYNIVFNVQKDQEETEPYTLTVTPAEHGTVGVKGTGVEYKDGIYTVNADVTRVTVIAVPDQDYEVKTINETSVTPVANNEYEVNVSSTNNTITVVFGEKATTEISYTVTKAPMENGHVDIQANTDNSYKFAEGDTVTLTVHPDDTYQLVADTLKATYETGEEEVTKTAGEENVYTFIMPAADVTVSATFAKEPKKYTVTVAKTVGGHLDFNGIYTFEEDADVTFTAIPDAGWNVTEVTYTIDGDTTAYTLDQKTDGSYTFKMPAADVTVSATFVFHVTGDVTLEWEDAPELIQQGKLLLKNTKPEKSYVVQVSNGDASVAICLKGTTDGSEIMIPCAPEILVDAWETDGYTADDILAVDPFDSFTTGANEE